MGKTHESYLADQIIRAVRRRWPGSYWSKRPAGGGQDVGTPDLLGVIRGRAIMIEVKRPGARPTRIQTYQLDQAAHAGAIALVGFGAIQVVRDVAERLGEPAGAPMVATAANDVRRLEARRRALRPLDAHE